MGHLKFLLAFVFILVSTFNIVAEDNIMKQNVGQSPPLLFVNDSVNSLPVKHVGREDTDGIVEDTLLPPCDIIFFKSGKIEYCKIIETNPTTIIYKMCDYQEGPNIVVNKKDVHKIRYANGREEVVVPSQPQDINAHVYARKDKMATWALISSLVGLVFYPALIAGIVLGFVSLGRIRRSNGELRGKGAARAAIIIGGIALLLFLIL